MHTAAFLFFFFSIFFFLKKSYYHHLRSSKNSTGFFEDLLFAVSEQDPNSSCSQCRMESGSQSVSAT